jgi:hypothetical protein
MFFQVEPPTHSQRAAVHELPQLHELPLPVQLYRVPTAQLPEGFAVPTTQGVVAGPPLRFL